MRAARFRFVLLLTVAVLFPLMSEEAHDADWYASEAKSALDMENYEYAVKVLKEGKKFFPDAYNLRVLLGDIYAEKELYSLAREEYEGALSRVPEDFSILYKTSQVLGKLNEEKKAVALLEKIHRLYPEDRDVISDLAWMYFKTYQLTRGEKLLKDSIEAFGSNRSFSMTLGTIYSGMYEYDLAKSYYLESIKDSAGEEGRYFASVAYYNLSLLERGFYHYNSALDYTDKSLSLADRAPGHLAKGELWKARMDFDKAHEEFQRAYAIDSTPLAKVSLADLYQQWGRYNSAKAYLDEVMNTENNAWMYYFGTDLQRHYMEIHRVYEDLYRGMAERERVMPERGIVKKIRSLASFLSYKALSWYHGRKYRSYAFSVGKFYLEEGNQLDADWTFYKANENYPAVALRYLSQAKEFETSIAPASLPFYLLEEGKMKKDPDTLKKAREMFHPVWERESIAEALVSLVPILYSDGQKTEARDAVNQLYEISPPALLVNGLGLPIEIEGNIDVRLLRGLKRSGCELSFSEGGPGFRYALSVSEEETGVVYTLTDMVKREIRVRIPESQYLSDTLGKLLQGIYGIEWYGDD